MTYFVLAEYENTYNLNRIFVFSIGLFKTEKNQKCLGLPKNLLMNKKNSFLALKFSATKLANQNRAK